MYAYMVQQQQEKDDDKTIAERKGDWYHFCLEQTKWGRGADKEEHYLGNRGVRERRIHT